MLAAYFNKFCLLAKENGYVRDDAILAEAVLQLCEHVFILLCAVEACLSNTTLGRNQPKRIKVSPLFPVGVLTMFLFRGSSEREKTAQLPPLK